MRSRTKAPPACTAPRCHPVTLAARRRQGGRAAAAPAHERRRARSAARLAAAARAAAERRARGGRWAPRAAGRARGRAGAGRAERACAARRAGAGVVPELHDRRAEPGRAGSAGRGAADCRACGGCARGQRPGALAPGRRRPAHRLRGARRLPVTWQHLGQRLGQEASGRQTLQSCQSMVAHNRAQTASLAWSKCPTPALPRGEPAAARRCEPWCRARRRSRSRRRSRAARGIHAP